MGGITPPAAGMARHLTIEFAVDWDGEGWHILNSTQTHDLPWADSYRAILMVRDDLQRQIDERFNCPFHPKAIKQHGLPAWSSDEGGGNGAGQEAAADRTGDVSEAVRAGG